MWCDSSVGSHDGLSGTLTYLPPSKRSKLEVAYFLRHPMFTLCKETAELAISPSSHLFSISPSSSSPIISSPPPQSTSSSSNHIQHFQRPHITDCFRLPSLSNKTHYPTTDFTMRFASLLYTTGVLATVLAGPNNLADYALQRLAYLPNARDSPKVAELMGTMGITPENLKKVNELSEVNFIVANPYPEPSIIQCDGIFNNTLSAAQQP